MKQWYNSCILLHSIEWKKKLLPSIHGLPKTKEKKMKSSKNSPNGQAGVLGIRHFNKKERLKKKDRKDTKKRKDFFLSKSMFERQSQNVPKRAAYQTNKKL